MGERSQESLLFWIHTRRLSIPFFPAAYGQYCYSLLSLPISFIGKLGVKGLMDVGILRLFLDNVLLVGYIVTLMANET
jgi:hypothetical protein